MGDKESQASQGARNHPRRRRAPQRIGHGRLCNIYIDEKVLHEIVFKVVLQAGTSEIYQVHIRVSGIWVLFSAVQCAIPIHTCESNRDYSCQKGTFMQCFCTATAV